MPLKKTLQIWSALVLFLFFFPVFINFLPDGGTTTSAKLVKEPAVIVHAYNVMEEEVVPVPEIEEENAKALLYFTHNHEAFEPVTKAKDGKIAVSHQSENISKFGEKLQTQLNFNGIDTDILPVDNQVEMGKNGIPYELSYKAIRPYVEKRIKEVTYDMIIDLHRDSAGRDVTTMVYNGESYAKIAFVIGKEHPNFASNRENARLLKEQMELLVPGITRELIIKGGPGVDGKYNQDLDPSLLVIELGGIGNSEDELNRTITVIAKAASTVLANPKSRILKSTLFTAIIHIAKIGVN